MTKIELINKDCMIDLVNMKENEYSLAICDPPYGINVANLQYTQEDNRPCKQKNGAILRVKKLKYKHGDWDKSPPPIEYFNELFRVSENQIIWGIKYFNLQGIKNGLIKWNKCVPKGVSFSNYEYAYCSLLDEEIEYVHMWAGMMQGSPGDRSVQQGNKKLNEIRIHPTQKPVALYKWLLKNYAKPGDKIIDTHGGSFSLVIACIEMGFGIRVYEIDKDYFDDAVKRVWNHINQLNAFIERPEIICNGIPIDEYIKLQDNGH